MTTRVLAFKAAWISTNVDRYVSKQSTAPIFMAVQNNLQQHRRENLTSDRYCYSHLRQFVDHHADTLGKRALQRSYAMAYTDTTFILRASYESG